MESIGPKIGDEFKNIILAKLWRFNKISSEQQICIFSESKNILMERFSYQRRLNIDMATNFHQNLGLHFHKEFDGIKAVILHCQGLKEARRKFSFFYLIFSWVLFFVPSEIAEKAHFPFFISLILAILLFSTNRNLFTQIYFF